MTDLPYYVAFSVFPGIGPARFKLLVNYFGNAKAAWEAPINEFRAIGLSTSLVQQLHDFRNTFSIDIYLTRLAQKQINAIAITAPEYPERLKQISDPPFVLYSYGQGISLLQESRFIGVVGTRTVTPYGIAVTQRLTRGLVEKDFVIVSGLALGVDTVAHTETLARNGKTIAVLGCGVDMIAPASNTRLYYAIAQHGGCIVSEMPLGHQPAPGLFAARNRIISGLSLGIVVTEGAEDSGSLITARYAAEQGREVFAVPGPITSYLSRGPAKLLKNGATLVEDASDIVESLSAAS